MVTSKSVWTCSLRSWGQRLMTVSNGNSISTSCPANFINNLPQFSHLCPVSSLAECISASEVPHAETPKLLSNPRDSFWTHLQWEEWHLLLHQLTNQRSNWQLKRQGRVGPVWLVRVFKWVASFILNNKKKFRKAFYPYNYIVNKTKVALYGCIKEETTWVPDLKAPSHQKHNTNSATCIKFINEQGETLLPYDRLLHFFPISFGIQHCLLLQGSVSSEVKLSAPEGDTEVSGGFILHWRKAEVKDVWCKAWERCYSGA